MLTCIACSKHLNNGSLPQQEEDEAVQTPSTKQAIKTITAQIKDMAVKASGAYKNCKPCSGSSNGNKNKKYADSDMGSDSARFNWAYRRTGSASSTPRMWGKEMEARLKGISSGEGTPTSVSGRTESVVFMEEEDEPKEWVAQVEPGVLITFVSLPQGGNDLKRIRFSREMFNKWQAQRWWAENYDKVMELYNVQRFNQQAVPLPTPPRSEDESSKIESARDSPVTPPLSKERLPRHIHHQMGMGYSSSDSLDHHHHMQPQPFYETSRLASKPNLSNIGVSKTERSSIDASVRTSSSGDEEDHSGELSISNASDMETEWVEQDEPGVYITIRALPGGTRELRRVRFSREKFGEMHARLWWEENRARIQEQYL
ncbi:Protein Brevis radix-like 2 [Trifolium repens]|nr:protein Brevis radix [Trifolium repens]WJX86488.1 Protein Brevis radix-like 2 [Trifolium repens]